MKTITKQCIGCGNNFLLSYYERNRQRYCTKECAYKNRLIFDRKVIEDVVELYVDQKKSLSDVALLVGLKYHNIRKILSDQKINVRTNALQQKINFEINPNRHNGSSSKVVCLQCNEEIVRWDSWIIRNKQRGSGTFCSKECFDVHRSIRDVVLRYGKGWNKARKLARKRDKVCQICGKSEKDNRRKLDVHHICLMRWFKENKLKANDLSNLVCLCPSCHTTVDMKVRKYEREYKRALSNSRQQDNLAEIGPRAFEEVWNYIRGSA